jgi:hypothetical protein
MGLFRVLTCALVLAFLLPIPANEQQSKDSEAFWDTGNDFLNQCDENSVSFAQLPAKTKEVRVLVCDFWVMGIAQGIDMAQKIRPPSAASPATLKYDKEYEEYKQQFGITPSFEVPAGNMCRPEIPANQLRLVVVQWMSANPTKLDQHGAWLTYAALTNTYPCPEKKGDRN